MKKIDEKLAAEISLKKPAVSNSRLSNSRLSGQTLGKSQPALSFDAMTIVGNLNKTNAKKLSDFMSVEPQIRLWDRRNMRVEFNPNKLTHEEMIWLKQNIIDYMEDDGFTRLDLAFDFEDDLSDYYAMTDKAVKKTVFYGRNGKPETKYFGVRDSDRFIRIYNKKQERKDNADVEVVSEHLWRVEVELKRDMVDYWNDCFNDLHILKPAWATLEKINEQAMVYTLLHEESMWGKLSKNTKTKFKKLIREISPIDLTELMKSTLKANEKQLQKQIDFWQREFRFWK